jgi:hypothetical protein
MSHVITVTDTTRERLAAGLYAKWRERSPGTLNWETDTDWRKDEFYEQADNALDVLAEVALTDEPSALAAIKQRLASGASHNLGTDIAGIIAEHEGGRARLRPGGPAWMGV